MFITKSVNLFGAKLKNLHEQFGSVFYKCDICYNCFENNINLSLRHMKTVHEGDEDFKCESSEKSFTQANSLRGHIKNIRKGHKYSHWH